MPLGRLLLRAVDMAGMARIDLARLDLAEIRQYRQVLLKSWQRAANTMQAYERGWRLFSAWCEHVDRAPLPATAETVTLYVTGLIAAGYRVSTAQARASAVAYMHRRAGHESPVGPEVSAVLSAARRLLKQRPEQKTALTIEQYTHICRELAKGAMRDRRNRAIIALGFTSGMRRSEVAALRMEDVEFTEQGLRVSIRASKSDQEGRGRQFGILPGRKSTTCPLRALEDWLLIRGRDPGPLFCPVRKRDVVLRPLRPPAIGQVVKSAIRRLGIDPQPYAGHSLRAGFVTAAAGGGASEAAIMQRTGHKSVQMVHRYFRPATVFVVNPLAGADI